MSALNLITRSASTFFIRKHNKGTKDTFRLDWLQHNQKTVWRVSHEERIATTELIGSYRKEQVFDGWTVDDEDNPKETIREAIDEAIRNEQQRD